MSIPSTPRHSRQSTMDYNRSNASSPQDQRRLSKTSSYNEPLTPSHQHHPSFGQGDGLDVFSSGGYSGGMGGMGSLGGLGSADDSSLGGGGGGGGMGLGNLADELADALSDSEEDDEEREDGDEYEDGDADQQQGQEQDSPRANEGRIQGSRDSGGDDVSTGSPQRATATVSEGGGGGGGGGHGRNGSLHVPTANNGSNGGTGGGRQGGRSGHKRTGSAYDGSEYGSDSDLDLPGMPPSLLVKIDAVEMLARRGTDDVGGPDEGVCKRLTEALRDLGSQSGVEGGASRLITAHSALTTHLAHQTRQLHALAFPLYSPLAGFGTMAAGGGAAAAAAARMPGLALTRNGRGRASTVSTTRGNARDTDESDTDSDDAAGQSGDDEDDDLQSMLTALVDQMPRPTTAAYQSLAALHGLTSDLVSTLTYLSDTLHMTRQTTTTATRRLRSAKELVAEMRRDDEVREQGERWLARGDWDARLRRRECAHVCGEVVGGFEEVCNTWRARLLAQAEAAAAANGQTAAA